MIDRLLDLILPRRQPDRAEQTFADAMTRAREASDRLDKLTAPERTLQEARTREH